MNLLNSRGVRIVLRFCHSKKSLNLGTAKGSQTEKLFRVSWVSYSQDILPLEQATRSPHIRDVGLFPREAGSQCNENQHRDLPYVRAKFYVVPEMWKHGLMPIS